MEKKKIYLILSLFLIISSIILAVLSIIFAYSISIQRNSFLEKEEIYFEKFSVKVKDGIEIKGLLYVDEDLEEKEDNSVPSVLLLHGLNGRKEHKMDIVFQFVKCGFAVFSVEQRGHGDSGGFISFLDKEPGDMEDVIDYIEDHFDFSNVSHIALLGFSYGGGIGAILQSSDDRIYASVLYHPLVSIKHLTELMPFQNLIGVTYSVGPLEDIKDGFDVCTPTNTANLLLIHGEDDELISSDDSKELYEQVDGNYRNDIGLEIRPDLNHFETEVDDESLKYAIVWLEHFYHDKTIDITNRDFEISSIKLKDFDYPESLLPEYLILISAIILFLGISLLLLPRKIWPLSSDIPSNETIDDERDPQLYKKMVLSHIVIYVIPVIIGAPLFAIFNPSYLFGYSLIIPIATIILFLLMPRFGYSDWKSKYSSHLKTEWNDWYNNNLKLLLYGLSIVMVPVLFYVIIFNFNANLMTSFPIPFFNTTMILYLSMGISTFYMDYLMIRGIKTQHSIILIGLRSLTLIIFFTFIPIPPFGFTGLPISGEIAQILIFSLMGLVFWAALMLMRLLKKIYKNIIPVMLIFFLPLTIFLLFLVIRIV
ncbi:MAG: alpha/beta hydrolase [Candidatus Hodarchaeota archaeon]